MAHVACCVLLLVLGAFKGYDFFASCSFLVRYQLMSIQRLRFRSNIRSVVIEPHGLGVVPAGGV